MSRVTHCHLPAGFTSPGTHTSEGPWLSPPHPQSLVKHVSWCPGSNTIPLLSHRRRPSHCHCLRAPTSRQGTCRYMCWTARRLRKALLPNRVSRTFPRAAGGPEETGKPVSLCQVQARRPGKSRAGAVGRGGGRPAGAGLCAPGSQPAKPRHSTDGGRRLGSHWETVSRLLGWVPRLPKAAGLQATQPSPQIVPTARAPRKSGGGGAPQGRGRPVRTPRPAGHPCPLP